MKIVVLNGSPRLDSNTKFLSNAFKDGAMEKGHEVTILDIAKMNISGCKACECCHEENGNGICVIRDDMDKVNTILHDSDMVILASPIHYWSFSGQMQSVITRFYAKGKPIKATKYAMILSSGSDNVYDAVIKQYNDILSYINAADLGIYTFYGYNQKTDENYNIMFNFGKSIYEDTMKTFEIIMENGKVMKGELYPDIAPKTVENFEKLANSNFYDGLIFHRVIPGFMIQGGDPYGNGMGGPGYEIFGEFSSNGFKNDLKHTTGVLSMARAQDPNSAGSQFFIMVADAPYLDGEYAAFGKVIEGIETALEIVNSERDWNDKPLIDQKIKSIRVK